MILIHLILYLLILCLCSCACDRVQWMLQTVQTMQNHSGGAAGDLRAGSECEGAPREMCEGCEWRPQSTPT